MTEDASGTYQFGPFRVVAAERVLRREGRIIPLTPKCFDTLLELARHGGSLVEKEKLIRAVWRDSFVEEGSLAQSIFMLRKALGSTPEGEQYIQTIPKRGYRLAVPVTASAPFAPSMQPAIVPAPVSRPRRIPNLIMAGILMVTTLVAARWVWRSGEPGGSPHIALLRVPNDVLDATISPDGKHFAYICQEAQGQSLWVRETEGVGAGVRVVPAAPGHYWRVAYSPNGEFLYYVFNPEAHAGEGDLFRISAGGGESRKLMADVGAGPVFSPNGSRMLLKRYDADGRGYLLTATPLGEDVNIIAQKQAAYPFHTMQWEPEGERVRYIERTNDSTRSAWAVWEMPSAGGEAKLLFGPQPRPLRSVNWLNRSEFLAVVPDEDSEMGQIWRVSLDGAFRRLTNGINDYVDISLSADAGTMLATSRETDDSIWTASATAGPHVEPVRMLLPPGSYNYPLWTADEHVVYAGSSNLWLSTKDGRERKPLIAHSASVNEPSVSADGRFAVFVVKGHEARNLWRVDLEGSHFRQVTGGQEDLHPAISPDGKWVVYEARVPAPWTLWKAPLDHSGPAIKLVENEGAEARIAFSPDSKLFAYRTDVGGIGIRSLDDGTLVRRMSAPADPSDLQWNVDGKAVRYICHNGRATEVWSQPVADGPPARVPLLLPLDVLHIDWSRDGTRVVYLQREIKTDLALITNFR